MTKTISEQICRTCGIQPIELTKCSFVNLREYGIEEGTDVCEHMEEKNFKCSECEMYAKDKEIFPDFGEADNFLKLYNMQVNGCSLCFLLHANYQINSSRQFLLNLKTMIEGKNAFCRDVRKAISCGRWNV